MRLIDADALIEKFGGWYVDECTESGFIGTLKDILATEPTIQPGKAQLPQQGTTSDLISRTETVEHLRRVLEATVPNTDYDEGYIDGIEVGISTVSTMPTTQPVATDTNVVDTISRQAVKYLDLFTKTYCRDKSATDDLVFRCSDCEFELRPSRKCLVKCMARKLCPDYKDFGSMGDL